MKILTVFLKTPQAGVFSKFGVLDVLAALGAVCLALLLVLWPGFLPLGSVRSPLILPGGSIRCSFILPAGTLGCPLILPGGTIRGALYPAVRCAPLVRVSWRVVLS